MQISVWINFGPDTCVVQKGLRRLFVMYFVELATTLPRSIVDVCISEKRSRVESFAIPIS